MIEFPGPEGDSVLVYRTTDQDMIAAAKSTLPDINRGGEVFGRAFRTFCTCWRPTGQEVVKILKMCLGPDNYAKIQRTAEAEGHETLRQKKPEWDDNEDWEEYVVRLSRAIGERFRCKVDMAAIQECKQGPNETG